MLADAESESYRGFPALGIETRPLDSPYERALLGIAAIWLLPDRPADAAWLPADERAWLEERLRAEREAVAARSADHVPWWRPLLDIDVLVLGLLYTGATVGTRTWEEFLREHTGAEG